MEAYISLLQGGDDPLQFTTAGKSYVATLTFPSEGYEFLGLGQRASGGTETSHLSTALAVTKGVPSASQ